MTTRTWTRLCGMIAFTTLATIAGCPNAPEDVDQINPTPGGAATSPNRDGNPGTFDSPPPTTPGGGAGGQTGGPGGSTGGGAAGGAGGAPAPGTLAAFIAPLQAQLADRFFEFGSSSISGSNSITGVLKLSLCGFGNARVVEQTIFSGSTPGVDLGFDSETITDGVWSLVDAGSFIALEVREFAAGSAQGALLKRFEVDFDANANLLGVDGRQILSTDDIAASCQQSQQQQQILDQAAATLLNKRAVLTDAADRGEIVLCESGNYGFRAESAGQLFIFEGGRWSIEPVQGGAELVLVSDPSFDANGQTFTSRLAITQAANGSVILGGNATTLTAIAGNCDAAIQTLLQ